MVLLGGFFALVAASTFAWTNAAVRRGVLSGSVAQATTLSIPVGVPVFFLALLCSGNPGMLFELPQKSVIVFACVGISHFVCGRYCNYRALSAVGTNLAGPVMQFNLVVSLSLAIFFLGETLTPLKIIGILLIVTGPAIASRERRTPPVPEPQAAAEAAGPIPDAAMPDDEDVPEVPATKVIEFKPRLVEGFAFAFLAALFYGASPALVRYAIDGRGITGGLAGGVIASAGASVVTLLLMFIPGRFAEVRLVKPEAAKWFMSSGTMVYVSQIFAYMAVGLAPVTITAPVMGLANVFRIHLSRWMNPHHEVFGPKIIMATGFSFLGVLALTASMDIIPLPEGVARVMNWHWP